MTDRLAPRGARLVVPAFLTLAGLLALLQLRWLHNTTPPPDGLAYFDVADQIPRVGYGAALSQHWSPLYPLYLLAVRTVTPYSADRELAVTAAADALLLLTLCVVVALAFRSLGRLCWPDQAGPRVAWLSYGCGLAIFFAFAILRVGLRMPDAIVTSLAVATLWVWCQASARGLPARWTAAAGLLSGLSYLARANLLHWSIVVGVLACVLAPGVKPRLRARAFAAFCLGLLLIFGPQSYLFSSARGRFTFGETGKIGFAVAYGAVWPTGAPAWPEVLEGGDVRLFTEPRTVPFPSFYEPSREYDDAEVQFGVRALMLAIARAANSCLMGNWSPSFALLWPMLWAVWPPLLFGVGRWSRSPEAGDGSATLRRRLAWLLTLAGSAGIGMHLVTFCNGYYLPPYLIASLMGICLAMLDVPPGDRSARERQRAALVAGVGFAVATTLLTVRYARTAEATGREANLSEARAMAAALTRYPAPERGLRKVAAVGRDWLGLYGVRLSGSQLLADIPNPDVLHDPARLAKAMERLQRLGIVALLVPRDALKPADRLAWQPIGSGAWTIVDLRPESHHEATP
jgi:4-amino-4-deoxy-L-arabinose transferase-like glycosyltransferase